MGTAPERTQAAERTPGPSGLAAARRTPAAPPASTMPTAITPAIPRAVTPRPATAPPAATVSEVARVAARMRELRAELRPGDGVRVFTGVYLSVTEEIARQVAAGAFADPAVAAVLAARFAGRFLAAVDGPRTFPADGRRPSAVDGPHTPAVNGPHLSAAKGGPRPPACWRALLRVRAHRGLHPLQFALAGINAHVGHDLPLAVVDTAAATGREPPALEADFDRVGRVLATIEVRVREELMPGPDLLEAAEPLSHLIGTWSLDRARDAAWSAARLLWALRYSPRARAECERRLDAAVAVVGRLLLTPVPR
jgi:hypothetical protein